MVGRRIWFTTLYKTPRNPATIIPPSIRHIGIAMITNTMLHISTLLVFFGIVMYLLYLFAASYVFLWKTRYNRRVRKHERTRKKIRTFGEMERRRMAFRFQSGYMREFAATVSGQVEARRRAIPPWVYQRITVYIERSVADVDFDRLFSLYRVFQHTEDKHLRPALDVFFQKEG